MRFRASTSRTWPATDTGGESQIFFVVREDSSHSNLVLKTSDTTWQAYNAYGGNSLYTCTVSCPPGNPGGYKAAYAVSYNRPFDGTLSTDNGFSDPFYAEYQLIRFLERNGYDMSYVSGHDLEANPSLLQNHKVVISSGHDEYWSPGERQAVESARSAGVSLAFFSGNEMFWKTRWGNSSEGSNTPYRTLITYKDTHFPTPVDPLGPSVTTGDLARPAVQPTRRRRPPRELRHGPGLHDQLGDVGNQSPGDVRQIAVLAQHGRIDPELGADTDAGARDGNARLRVGRQSRQRLPSPGPHLAVVDDGQRSRSVQRLRHRGRKRSDGESQPLPLQGAKRSAGVRRRHGPVVMGAGRHQCLAQERTEWHRARPDDAAGDCQPAGGHGGAARDPPVRSHRHPGIDRHHAAKLDDHLAIRRCGADRR